MARKSGAPAAAWRIGLSVAAIAALHAPGAPAVAQNTPSVGCEVSDFSMAMTLYLPLAADGSGGLSAVATQALQGTLELRHSKIPPERRHWKLDGRKPAMFWNRGGELKILLLLGTGEEQISIVIETSNKHNAGEHVGNFRIESNVVKLTGRVACGVG